MAAVFLDSSALVRRYDRSEPGSANVRRLCARSSGDDLLVARIASVEVASAFGRKVREGALASGQVARLWRLFRGHWQAQYQLVNVSDETLARAERLVLTRPLRAYDAIHLGCALLVASHLPRTGIEFWTVDRRQAQAASAEGLAVRLVG